MKNFGEQFQYNLEVYL